MNFYHFNKSLVLPVFSLLSACSWVVAWDTPNKNEAVVAALPYSTVSDTSLDPVGEHTKFLHLRAEGVQIYECKIKTDAKGGYDWIFRAPQATLYDDEHKAVGLHYAGPTWELSDGSKTVGTVIHAQPASKQGAITWLLLKAKPLSNQGLLSEVIYIQRVDTTDGVAPAKSSCDAKRVGQEARVKYSATYNFFN